MADFNKHFKVGIAVGGTAALVIDLYNQNNKVQSGEQQSIDFSQIVERVLAGMVVGAIFGVLPDLLEPATSPFHREVFHSWTTAGGLCYGLYKTQKSEMEINGKNFTSSSILAYLSHLFLDLQTPIGLPII